MTVGVGDNLLVVRNLTIHYPLARSSLLGLGGSLQAVDRVSFDIRRGETFGLVGESGCGKSSLGRGVLRLQEPTSGELIFDGSDLMSLSKGELRLRRRRMQMIFQDSYASLNPYMRVAEIVAEPMHVFGIGTRRGRLDRVRELIAAVGLEPSLGSRYPHELSGGQRQRVNIARALALEPSFIVCDEPVSALDVTVQAQIIDLLLDLQSRFGLTYLFISHDLSVVRELCHRIAIMYLGQLCEIGDGDAIYATALHPYTRALLSAVPIPDPLVEARRESERVVLEGEPPNAFDPPAGCRFSGRCPMAAEVCRRYEIECAVTAPILAEGEPRHRVACHLHAASRPQ